MPAVSLEVLADRLAQMKEEQERMRDRIHELQSLPASVASLTETVREVRDLCGDVPLLQADLRNLRERDLPELHEADEKVSRRLWWLVTSLVGAMVMLTVTLIVQTVP